MVIWLYGRNIMKQHRTLADSLPAEIKRVQAKKERWIEYQKDAGPRAIFGPTIAMMQIAIDEGIDALASGDVVRMLRADADLKEYNEDD